MMDVIETYRHLTEELGLSVLFVKHPELNVVQGTPLGEAIRKATLALLGIAAEIERALISERTKAGLARVRLGGGRLGRRPTQIPGKGSSQDPKLQPIPTKTKNTRTLGNNTTTQPPTHLQHPPKQHIKNPSPQQNPHTPSLSTPPLPKKTTPTLL